MLFFPRNERHIFNKLCIRIFRKDINEFPIVEFTKVLVRAQNKTILTSFIFTKMLLKVQFSEFFLNYFDGKTFYLLVTIAKQALYLNHKNRENSSERSHKKYAKYK